MPKRANGEGCIRKLPNGSWRGEIMLGYTPEGKRRVESFTAKKRNDVVTELRRRKQLYEDNIIIDKNLGFTAWAERWYKNYDGQVKPSTYAGYRYTINILEGYFKDMPVGKILPIDIDGFYDKLVLSGYSLSAITKCRAMMIQIFTAADKNGLVARNAAILSKKVTEKDHRLAKKPSEKDAFTDEEVEKLMSSLPDNLFGNGTRAMLGTGMRVQELVALKPEDIAPDGSWVDINKAIETVKGKPVVDVTKSKSSNRRIPVPTQFRKSMIYLRGHNRSEYIYALSAEKPYAVSTFRHAYERALAKIPEVRQLSPHCCRHTYATMLQRRGVNIELISKLMGHSGIVVTGKYIHTDFATLEQAAYALEQGREVA